MTPLGIVYVGQRVMARSAGPGCGRGRPIDLAGMKFGRLAVIERAGMKNGVAAWRCRCDCGAEIVVAGKPMRDGRTRSCGCLAREETGTRSRTHGETGTRTYNAWANMIGRCTRKSSSRWADYGARGIRVSGRWLTFANFLADMGECPPGLTIDRINNDGNYEPGNCRWATRVEQANNHRGNRKITFAGRTQNLRQWAAEIGMHERTLSDRLDKGWPVDIALTTPVGVKP